MIVQHVQSLWETKLKELCLSQKYFVNLVIFLFRASEQLLTLLNRRTVITDPFYFYSSWSINPLHKNETVILNHSNLLSLVAVLNSNSALAVRTSAASQIVSLLPIPADLYFSIFSKELVSIMLNLLLSPISMTWGVLGLDPYYNEDFDSNYFSYEFFVAIFRLFSNFVKVCLDKKVNALTYEGQNLPLKKLPALLLPCVKF